MKRIVTGLFIILISIVFSLHVQSEFGPIASINWENTDIDFGKIPFDKPIIVEFKFKNPGMMPLIITSVKPSCGCTVADFPKQPIPSGGEGTISVTFDAKLSGYFSKTITVHSNTGEGITDLFIKGEVIK